MKSYFKGTCRAVVGSVGPDIQLLYNIVAGNSSEQARESNQRLPPVRMEPASPASYGQIKLDNAAIEPSTFKV